MSLELALAIWLACLYVALGDPLNLAAKGMAALTRLPQLRAATSSRPNRDSAARQSPRQSGGKFFMDQIEMEWPK